MEGVGKFEASSPPCLETVSSAKNWRGDWKTGEDQPGAGIPLP